MILLFSSIHCDSVVAMNPPLGNDLLPPSLGKNIIPIHVTEWAMSQLLVQPQHHLFSPRS